MNKLLSIIAVFACTVTAVSAQRTGSVSGQITSNETAEKIAGATVELRSVADTLFVRGTASGPDSKFTIAELPYGEYTMNVSALGFKPQKTNVTVNARNIQMGHVFLQKSVIQMDEVSITAQAMRVSAKGDTIVYNAAAFKTSEFADADELLRQLPGVEVGEDGTVKAQGKNVQKIFVDGKETFGTDVATTMKNIPANVIDKVEVYNKLSDFAETTGINDGDDYQVMNFVTGVTFAQMGTYTALYGIKDKYAFELRHQIVTGNHGIMLNGTANNTGSMGFGGGFGGFGGGIIAGMMGGGGYGSRFGGGRGMSLDRKSVAQSAGVNYNYQNGEKIRVSFYYGFGHRENESESSSDRTYFKMVRDLYNRSIESGTSSSLSNAHNFGGNVNWKMTDKQTLSFRFSGSYSDNGSESHSLTRQFTDTEDNLFMRTESDNRNDSENYSLSGGLNYGLKFDKQGRSLSIGLNGSIGKTNGNSLQNILIQQPSQPDSLRNSTSVSDNDNWNVRLRAQYSEPLSAYWSLMSVYDYSNGVSNSDVSAKLWKYYDDFNDGQWIDWGEGSNIMEVRTLSHRVGPGIYFTKNQNIFRIDFVYKYTEQNLERTLPLPYMKDKVSFSNFVYNAMYRKRFTPQSSMEFRLEADTQNPSISQLQDVDNLGSSLYVTTGNPDLKPYYTHTASVDYNKFGLTNGTSITVGANGSMTTDYIGTWKKIVVEDVWVTPNGTPIKKGGQYSRPINLNKSAWSFGVNANYGKPLSFIKSNFNVSARFNYNESPGMIDEDENTAKTQSLTLSANLNSNWSTNFTAGLTYGFSPGVTNNTHPDYGRSTNLNQSIRLNVTWKTVWDLVFRTNATYTNNLNKQQNSSNDYRFENLACNMSLGKQLFKNKRGEIAFTVNDLFDQNSYTSQSVFPDYIENAVTKGVGRYFSLSFTYRLRDFQKNGQSMGGRGERPDRGDFRFDGERGGRSRSGGVRTRNFMR